MKPNIRSIPAILLCVFAPFAQEDPEWLLQDGQITESEANELQELELRTQRDLGKGAEEVRFKVQMTSQVDSSGIWRKPTWKAQGSDAHFNAKATGDSTLRLWQVFWKERAWTAGAGHWNSSTLNMAWANESHLGGWAQLRLGKMEASLAGAPKETGISALAWRPAPYTRGTIAWQHRSNRNSLFATGESRAMGWLLAKPLQNEGAYSKITIKGNGIRTLRITQQLTWNNLDTTQDELQLSSRELHSVWLGNTSIQSQLTKWNLRLNHRWRQIPDSTTEWILLAQATRSTEHSTFSNTYSVITNPNTAPKQFYRTGAEWGMQNSRWRGIGMLQWSTLQKHWQARPQLESGLRWDPNSKIFLRLSVVVPTLYPQNHQAQWRGLIQGPCFPNTTLRLRWSLQMQPDQKPFLHKGKIACAFTWQL